MALIGSFTGQTTAGSALNLNAAPSDMYIEQSGLGTGDVTLSSLGTYSIDVFGDVKRFMPMKTPLLTIAANLGSEKMTAPYVVWTDIYEGEEWADIKLDDLRLSSKGAAFGGTNWSLAGGDTYVETTTHKYGTHFTDGSDLIRVTITGHATFAAGDRVKISGTTNHNGVYVVNAQDTDYIELAGTSWDANPNDDGASLVTLLEDHPLYVDGTTDYLGRAGQLQWQAVTTELDGTHNMLIGAGLPELALSSSVLKIGFDLSDDFILGKKEQVIRKIANLLDLAGYDENDYTGAATGSVSGKGYEYLAGTSKAVYLAFDDLAWAPAVTGVGTQESEVVVQLKEFVFNDDFSAFYMYLDFSDSNISSSLASSDIILLEEIATASATSFSPTNNYSRMSRHALITNYSDVPGPVAEGGNFTAGGNYIYGQESKTNNAQIFRSDKYGITGTRAATTLRFIDDWVETRKRKLMIYKRDINNALIWGKKSERFDGTSGYPIRGLGGMLDYELFPIKYMKKTLGAATDSAATSSDVYGYAFKLWMEGIAESLNAFKQGNGDSHTLLASRYLMNRIRDHYTYIASSHGPNILGFNMTTNPASGMTLGLEVNEVKTYYGTLRFVHEPALDYMPSIKNALNTGHGAGVPTHLFSAALNPRTTLIAIDKSNISMPSLRPDKLEGNIQDVGQDAFYEGYIGEHSFKLRFPKNHAIIDCS